MSVRETALVVPDAILHVASVGGEHAPPLLVLHGGPGEAHDSLRPWLDRLASPARCVVYFDQRGGGRSTVAVGSAPASWEQHARDVDAVRVHLGVDRIDLLGFSWGALLALLYAGEHPQRVAQLVLVSPPPTSRRHDEAMRDGERRAAARPEVMALRARLAPIAEGGEAEAARRARFAQRMAPYFADPSRALDLEPVDTRVEAAEAVSRSLSGLDLAARFPALRSVPALVVCGAADPVPEAAAAETAHVLGARHLVLARAGHAPFVEAADEFVREVMAFLDGRADAGRP